LTYLESIILGVVQGLAEFLPISSSGHLALLQHFFGIQADKVLMFTVMMHIGTLVSVFIMYWHDIWELIKELFIMIADLCTGKGLRLAERPVRKLGLMIIVATIPAAIAGLAFNDFFDSLNSNLLFIGFGFLITGFLLYFLGEGRQSQKRYRTDEFQERTVCGNTAGNSHLPGNIKIGFDHGRRTYYRTQQRIRSKIRIPDIDTFDTGSGHRGNAGCTEGRHRHFDNGTDDSRSDSRGYLRYPCYQGHDQGGR
jgi:undecaprenyl-diphosphatase